MALIDAVCITSSLQNGGMTICLLPMLSPALSRLKLLRLQILFPRNLLFPRFPYGDWKLFLGGDWKVIHSLKHLIALFMFEDFVQTWCVPTMDLSVSGTIPVKDAPILQDPASKLFQVLSRALFLLAVPALYVILPAILLCQTMPSWSKFLTRELTTDAVVPLLTEHVEKLAVVLNFSCDGSMEGYLFSCMCVISCVGHIGSARL